MSSYKFWLGWPPSINGYWRNFKGRQIISKRGRDYRIDSIARMVKQQLLNKKIQGRLSVVITLCPPTLRKYDIDNFCKALFDAITHSGFWVDDEQIDLMIVEKGGKEKGGCVYVEVETIE